MTFISGIRVILSCWKHERGDVEMLKKGEGGKRSLERRMEGRGRRGEKSRGGGGERGKCRDRIIEMREGARGRGSCRVICWHGISPLISTTLNPKFHEKVFEMEKPNFGMKRRNFKE